LLDHWVAFDNLRTHTVEMNLRVIGQIGVTQKPSPVVSWSQQDEADAISACPQLQSDQPFAVLHVSPKYVYKAWSSPAWGELAQWLHGRGLRVLVVGGGDEAEIRYVDSLMTGFPQGTVNLAGKIGLGALGYLLSRASLYVGTDTAVTHMAAALGIPTIALFGPSNPVKWGPWPRTFSGSGSPWDMRGSKRIDNVFLVQGEKHCVPCLQEGCDRHIGSLSECLQKLPSERVIAAAGTMLQDS
jgi:heptosyltransferase-3